jgi:hypothetical protein
MLTKQEQSGAAQGAPERATHVYGERAQIVVKILTIGFA